MFDMEKIGRFIKEQREQASLTQEELATKLLVPQRTISSCEQGMTMPDINHLPAVAELFAVSIDELLGRQQGSRVVSYVAEGKVEELAAKPVTVEEFRSVSPVLRPQQLVEISVALDTENSLREHLEDILPHVSREVADKVVGSLLQRGEDLDMEDVIPYLTKPSADRLVLLALEQGKIDNIEDILPFVSREAAGKLVAKALEKGNELNLEDVLPFVSREDADALVLRRIESIDVDELENILPFLSREFAGELVINNVELSPQKIKALLPHVNRETADKLILQLLEMAERKD